MKKRFQSMGYLLLLMSLPLSLLGCQVSTAAGFEVLSLDVTPSKVITGEKFNVKADINNAGKSEVTCTVPVVVNGIVDDRKLIPLAPGESREVEFTLARSKAGQYDISIGNKSAVVTVDEALPAAFKISDLNINMDQANPGDEVVITARISNAGGSQGNYIAELKINGTTEQSEKLTMPPGVNYNLVFKVTRSDPGTYTINLGDLTGKLTVLEPVRQIQITTPNSPNQPICPPAKPGSQRSACCP